MVRMEEGRYLDYILSFKKIFSLGLILDKDIKMKFKIRKIVYNKTINKNNTSIGIRNIKNIV